MLANACVPSSIAPIKEQLGYGAEAAFAPAAVEADKVIRESFDSPDHTQGVAVFEEIRGPRFAPLLARPQA